MAAVFVLDAIYLYMENFTKITPEWMAEKYDEFNKKMFGGKLPPCEFVADDATSRWGVAMCRWEVDEYGEVSTHNFLIKMSNAWNFPEHVKENTLAHEMIHIEDYYLNPQHFYYYDNGWVALKYQAHGNKFFQPEAKRLRQYGFDINTYATKEECAVSIMNDEARKKVEAKRQQMANIRYSLLAAKYTQEVSRDQVAVYKLRNIADAKKMADELKEKDKRFFTRWGKHMFETLEYYDVMSKMCSHWKYSKDTFECQKMFDMAWDKLLEDLGKNARLCERWRINIEIDPELFKKFDMQMQLAENNLTNSEEDVIFNETEQVENTPIQGGETVATMNADGTLTTEIA